ncbi:MAG: chloride channel protein, partial [Ilumatobacter sp.]|nr:chloride channel protein [Ilumatobacter sp.]
MNRTSWIPAHRQEELRSLVQRSRQVVLLAALTGAVTGLIVAGFEALSAEVLFDRVLRMSPWVAAWMPAAGLLVGLAIRKWIGRGVSPATTDEYLHAFHDQHHQLGIRALFARMLAAVATIGSGVPMGMEGPSLYAGASLGA